MNSRHKRENPVEIKFNIYEYKPKHTKFAFDNMMKTVKSSSINIIINILNIKVNEIIKLKEIEQIEFLKIKPDTNNPTKKYYLDLLQRNFRQIIGSNVTKKFKNKDSHNKEIIEKIYKIYEKGNYQKGIKDLVDFLNMKYIAFWDGLKNHMNQGDKKIISVNENKDNNIFLTSLIEGFIPKVDECCTKSSNSCDYDSDRVSHHNTEHTRKCSADSFNPSDQPRTDLHDASDPGSDVSDHHEDRANCTGNECDCCNHPFGSIIEIVQLIYKTLYMLNDIPDHRHEEISD